MGGFFRRQARSTPKGVGGFSLVEMMVAIAIGGILASIAIPNYKQYKYKAQAAEAYINLGTIARGLKAYYQQDHWREGVITQGKSAVHNGCLPEKTTTSNSPSVNKKTMLDWESEGAGWRAIGFTPADPLLHSYSIKTCWGEDNCSMASLGIGAGCQVTARPPNGYKPGCCGHNGLTGGYIARARGRMGPTINNILTMYFCSTDDNELFVCGRRHGSPGCGLRIAPSRAPTSTVRLWALMLIGLSVAFRRVRPGRG